MLALNDGGTANYMGGSGSSALTFSYTVAAGQSTAALTATALNLNGGTVKNGAGAAASLSLSGMAQVGPQIDIIPVISSITENPSNGHLKAGKSVIFTVNFNVPVVVSGSPTLSLNDGGTASYTGGSGNSALTFTYTVVVGENVKSLAATAVNLNGGSIVADPPAGPGPAANLSLTGLIQVGPEINTMTPAISSIVESPSSGGLNAGNTGTLTLNFSEAVTVGGGTPTLTLNDGGTATYTGGSGTSALTFNYTVGAAQNEVSLAATAVNLNGASIADDAGNDANLSLTGLIQVGPEIGTTTVVQVADQYILASSSGNGPPLQVNGAPFTTSEAGGWAPIGAVQTVSGFQVAWKLAGADEYGVWTTDSNGNFVSNTGAVTGESYTLEAAELTFNQDLNGDGTIGPSTTVIQTDTNSFGPTSLVKVADQYALGSNSGNGPHLQVNGVPFTTSEAGGWAPIGAVQIATGFQVAWKLAGADEYGVWTTDSNGNFVSNTGAVTGESYTLEAAEPNFNQDLNGDGIIGPSMTAIRTDTNSFGSTSLVQVADQYAVGSSSGNGPHLQVNGVPFTTSEAGGWAPIGAVQVATGFQVAWKLAGADEYGVWTTDSNGNFVSNTGAVTGESYTLESAELTFNQDLNGDGVMGPPTLVIQANETIELAGAYSGTITFAAATGTLKLDHSSTFSGSIAGQLATSDVIDLADITAGAATVAYSGNNSPGTLTVSDGTHTAHIGLLGNYSLADFTVSSDGHGGTSVVDPPLSPLPFAARADSPNEDFANPGLLNQYLAAFAPRSGDSAFSVESNLAGYGGRSPLADPVVVHR
jgi:hypothetical protein